MGLFDFLKKKQATQPQNLTQQILLKLQGPKFLRQNLVHPISNVASKFKITHPDIQWAGQLISSEQNRYFQIKYYGDLMDGETIINTNEAVQKVIAVDTNTKEEILLFDKIFHGWDGFICNSYQEQKNINREANKIYRSKTDSDKFQVLFLAYYNSGTKEELLDLINPEGQIELESGSIVSLQDAFDNAFDAVVIYAIDEEGNKFEIINEELA